MQYVGIQTQIARNNWNSMVLLLMFPCIILGMLWVFCCIFGIRDTYDYYGNEQCAVAAYNAGFEVSNWLDDPNCSSDGMTLDVIPYPETSKYVGRVQSAKSVYEKLYPDLVKNGEK